MTVPPYLAEFLPRFVAEARRRVRLALSLGGEASPGVQTVIAELHTMAGDAAVLGLADISEKARAAERAVKERTDDAATHTAALRLARTLARAVEELAGQENVDSPAAEATASPEAKARRVLIVDDSDLMASLLSDGFGRAGVEAHVATTLDQALELARSLRPAVVVADVQMPDCEVGTLCQRLGELDFAAPSVLLLSGLGDDELAPLAARVRASGFLCKDRGMDAVVQWVVQAFAAGNA